MEQPKKKRNFWQKLLRVVWKTLLFLFLFIILLIILIQTPPVQNFIRKQAVNYLEKKLDTKVGIGRLYINFTKKVVLENVYVEDRQKDTLLYGGKIKVDVSIVDLIFGDLQINQVQLEDMTAKIKRQLPDTAFNFQFIIDAFVPADDTPKETTDTSSSSPVPIKKVVLDNIRLVYKDIVTGNDVEAWLGHFDTRIDELDPGINVYRVPKVNLSGLTARVYQSAPMATPDPPAKDMAEAQAPAPPMQILVEELSLDRIKVDFRNDVSSFYANLDLGKLLVRPDRIDMSGRQVVLDELTLAQTTAAIRLGKTQAAKVVEKEVEQEAESRKEAGWVIRAKKIRLDENNIAFDNDNNTRQTNGMDYAHLHVNPLTLHADDFVFSDDSIAGKIRKARLHEQEGFMLQDLRTDFAYTSTGAVLSGLYLQTPGTVLRRNAVVRYPSLESLEQDIGRMEIDLDLADSKLAVKDVLTFVPDLRTQPAFADPDAVWLLNSRIKGSIADLRIDALQLQGASDTKLDVRGRLKGLPDMDKMSADLVIKTLRSSRRDLARLLPAGTLPNSVTLPGSFNLSGTIKGSMQQVQTSLDLHTDLGNAHVSGIAASLTDETHARYDLLAKTDRLDLGTILQDTAMLGPVTAEFRIKGTGYDPATANATLDGHLLQGVFQHYNYRDMKLTGSIANQLVDVQAGIQDPNIHLALQARADLSQTYPSVQLETMIDSIKTQALNLTSDAIIYRGKITADFPVTNPDSLEGRLLVTELLLVQNEERVKLDTLSLTAGSSDSGRFVRLHSDAIQARLEGNYRLTRMGDIISQAIQPYFAVKDSVKAAKDSSLVYDFRLEADIVDAPLIRAFVPDLKRLDSVQLRSRFSDNEGWEARLTAPVIEMGSNSISGLEVTAAAGDTAINVDAQVAGFRSGNAVQLFATKVNARLSDNQADFTLNTRDSESKDRYNLSARLRQPSGGEYEISLRPDDLLLNYEKWSVPPDNILRYGGDGVLAQNFRLSHNGQELLINSTSSQPGAPLDVSFHDFRLSTLTGFVETDSSLVDGLLNGKAQVRNLTTDPMFTADLQIADLQLQGDTVGNVAAKVSNKSASLYDADIAITGRGNDVQLKGDYNVNTSSANMLLDIRKLPMTTAQAFSGGALREATGDVNGQFRVTGELSQPVVRGDLNFNKVGFNLSTLNNYFRIDQEKLQVTEQGIRFNRFQVRDSANNQLVIDGLAATRDFSNYNLDLDINARNFRALNSTKKDNKLFYGQLYFDANLDVKGTSAAPQVEGRFKVNEKTKMTIVLPQSEPGVVDREGVVEFVDMDAPLSDSLFLAAYDSLNVSNIRGMEASVNIEIDKAADLTLIVDEGNGDFLNVQGEASLNATIDPGGEITLAGSYELEDGAYELSFNGIRRKFNIQKGSKLVWGGEPTDATVDITAVYIANTAPLDLVKSQLGEDVSAAERNTYLQKLPFDVKLMMTGKLLQPKIKFDIILPDNKSYVVSNDIIATVRNKLDQLRQEEGEMNKQVFALLLLNRFIAENPFNTSNTINAATLARQSVSKLMTEQLNRLASDLVKGVDLNFDVQSSEDYTTGKRADRTDLNVGLSKRLLNDRLTVTVGSNFELEGPQNSNQQASNIAGNIAIDYRLSKDGRYRLRAYRKNEYQGVIEGYIIETGVGFIITLDYNRFREIFQQKKIQKRREENRKRREQEQEKKAEGEEKQTSPAAKPTTEP